MYYKTICKDQSRAGKLRSDIARVQRGNDILAQIKTV